MLLDAIYSVFDLVLDSPATGIEFLAIAAAFVLLYLGR